jgi:NAD(P)-dependent dehydrogenase (short-subunit alcohol dehydrogenase family)
MLAYDLTNRTVLVAGASSGIGAHFAQVLAEAGAKVALAARRTDKTQALADALGRRGLQAMAVTMDVLDEDSVTAGFDAVEANWGTVHSVIANAGTATIGRSTEQPLDKVRQVIDTNYLGTYVVAREAARRLIAAGSAESEAGRILFISSITSLHASSRDTAYASSKAAVNHLAQCMAREWIKLGINVNTICPGYMHTELTGDWLDQEPGRQLIDSFPRKRILPIESLDDMVLFFCSDASRHVTGAQITIDDGQSL